MPCCLITTTPKSRPRHSNVSPRPPVVTSRENSAPEKMERPAAGTCGLRAEDIHLAGKHGTPQTRPSLVFYRPARHGSSHPHSLQPSPQPLPPCNKCKQSSHFRGYPLHVVLTPTIQAFLHRKQIRSLKLLALTKPVQLLFRKNLPGTIWANDVTVYRSEII